MISGVASKKSKESWPRVPGFGYPQREFVLHEKDEPWSPLAPPKAGKHRRRTLIRRWKFDVRCSFFKHKTPGQSHLSLTWPKGPSFSGQNEMLFPQFLFNSKTYFFQSIRFFYVSPGAQFLSFLYAVCFRKSAGDYCLLARM